jgi:UDP-N-acetylglucosamine 2-epimerase
VDKVINRTNGYFHHEIEMLKTFINKKMVLVLGHRGEFWGRFVNLCEALLSVSERDDVAIVLCTSDRNVKGYCV